MSSITLKNVVKKFGEQMVIPPLDLPIDSGKLTVILGPSGCGKSTLLRLIAGLEYPDSGQILIDGKDITPLEPRDRNVAMVFQNYALYPHLTVQENLEFPLKVAKLSKEAINTKVTTAAEMLGLTPLLNRYPKTLSGGERQRTALGRAIVRDPKIFLFDEPLSNLDFQLRNQMRGEIKSLQQRLRKTAVFVTHDQTEAMTMADKLVVLNKGRVMQIGTPTEIYSTPSNIFTAGFIGSPPMNFLTCIVESGKLYLDPEQHLLSNMSLPDGKYTVGIRPDQITTTATQDGIPFTLDQTEFHGSALYLHGKIGSQQLVVRGSAEYDSIASELRLSFDPKSLHIFDPASGLRKTL